MKRLFTVFLIISLLLSCTVTSFADNLVIGDEEILNAEVVSRSSSSEIFWPTTSTRITSNYGPRICPNHGEEFHTGVDIGKHATDDPVWSADYGNVVFNGWSTAYGNVVLINSEFDERNMLLQTRYAHLKNIYVSNGSVNRGQYVGIMGETGPAFGVHLHYETRDIDNLSTVWGGATNSPLTIHSGILPLPLRAVPMVSETKVYYSLDGYGISKNDMFFSIDYLLEAPLEKLHSFGISSDDISLIAIKAKDNVSKSDLKQLKLIANKLK